jgi:hypothetical protein
MRPRQHRSIACPSALATAIIAALGACAPTPPPPVAASPAPVLSQGLGISAFYMGDDMKAPPRQSFVYPGKAP